MTTLTTKLGTHKGLPLSRIWIEGKRLSAVGFTRGTLFNKDFNYLNGVLTLTVSEDGKAKVSGKGDHPLIDMTGKKVAAFFVGNTTVDVEYTAGKIVIKGSK